MSPRRSKGDGAIYQRHDHASCPTAVNGERPEHRCQGRWVGVVDLGWSGGKRLRRTYYGRTRKEVKVKIDTARDQQRTGGLLASSPTVESWLKYWLDVICVERGLKVNTMKSHRSKVETYLIPHLGRHRLDKLAPEHIRTTYTAMRDQKLSEATIRQTHAILRRALTVAVRERKAPYNAADMIDPPKTEQKRVESLTTAQARLVLDRGDLRWWLALYLGLRQGEALALRWSDVDLVNGTVTVTRSLVRVPREGLRFDTPKSANSVRVLPLPTPVLVRFKIARTEDHAARLDALIFRRPDGGPLDPRADWQSWREVLTALELPLVRLHSARHTAAGVLEEAGAPDRMAMQILGQGSLPVTHRYQHADLERMAQALTAAASLLEPSSPDDSGEGRRALGVSQDDDLT